jgi:hypothetical protein
MRKYRPSASSSVRLAYGIEVSAGLDLFPETQPLRAPFGQTQSELRAALLAREAAGLPMLEARAALRVVNLRFDQTVRTLARATEIADGGRRGPVYSAVFPEGVVAVLAFSNARQVTAAEALVRRLESARLGAADGLRAEWVPRLRAGIDGLAAAVGTYTTARAAFDAAFAAELGQRDEHERAVERLMGQIRTLFPGDRGMQDVFFPERSEGAGGEDAEVSAVPEEVAVVA